MSVRSAWYSWLEENITSDGTPKGRPHWHEADTWIFQRDDGVLSGHKMESPFRTWEETLETSMEVYDDVLPIGEMDKWPKELEEAYRGGIDIDFSPVYHYWKARK